MGGVVVMQGSDVIKGFGLHERGGPYTEIDGLALHEGYREDEFFVVDLRFVGKPT
jgi:hypothetical protein